MTQRLLIGLLVLVLLAAAIFGWQYYRGWQSAGHARDRGPLAGGPPPATVSAAEAVAEEWQPSLNGVGSLVATQEVFVSSDVAGLVEAIEFESGQRVAAGDLLVRLDAAVDQAELKGLVAERRLSELKLGRIRKLLEQNSASTEDFDEAQANLQGLEARVAAKQEGVIDKKEIRAPFAGVLGIRLANLGEYLSPGARVVSLQALDPMYADYYLPEKRLAQVAAGQRVEVRVQAYAERTFEGQVEAISPRVEDVTRSFQVRALLSNPDGLLRPGMFVEARTVLRQTRPVVAIPWSAITYAPYGDSVFVLSPEEGTGDLVALSRQVSTGEVREGRVEIVQGLQAGERVVLAGQVKLRNGQKVRIQESAALDSRAADR